ncbi:MYND-type domain-containing protein, partial [Haematococcus lacustris]
MRKVVVCQQRWQRVLTGVCCCLLPGLAPCVRAWVPRGKDDLMATGDDAPEGHVMIWDIQPSCGWRRLQTLETSAPVVTLVMAGSHLAAGTASGSVVVWRRDSDGSFQPLFSRPLTLDSLALRNVALTTAPDGTPLLVVQASGRNAIGMWRLNDGKMARMEMETDPDDQEAVVAANMQLCHVEGVLLAGVSYMPGCDPTVQL